MLIRSLPKLCFVLLSVTFTWGCAGLNEGVNEYRYGVKKPKLANEQTQEKTLKTNCPTKKDGKDLTVQTIFMVSTPDPTITCQIKPDPTTGSPPTTTLDGMEVQLTLACHHATFSIARTVANGQIGEPITCIYPKKPSKYDFSARYFPNPTPQEITENESISIRLLQAYICDFKEKDWGEKLGMGLNDENACMGGDGEQSTKTQGEIVVLANIVERGSTDKAIAYSYSDIKERGRVVFYSEDVRETGQLLNFSNMPVYGPITYKGNPLYMEFNILELDNEEAAEMKSMLSTLAALGSTAYPPSAMALSILDSLGGALLSGEQDDLELRYQMEFDAPKTNNLRDDEHRAVLAPGIYAFVRQENRNVAAPWDDLDFDEKTGNLLRCDKPQGTSLPQKKCPIYRDATWFVLKISRGEKSINLDVGEAFASFFEKNKVTSTKNITEIQSEFTAIGQEIHKIITGHDTDKAMKVLADAKLLKGSFEKEKARLEIANALCDALKKEKPTPLLNNFYQITKNLKEKKILGEMTKTDLAIISEKCETAEGGVKALKNHLFPS